jgi:hypothetical protein
VLVMPISFRRLRAAGATLGRRVGLPLHPRPVAAPEAA